jgi:hypothetical protein
LIDEKLYDMNGEKITMFGGIIITIILKIIFTNLEIFLLMKIENILWELI